MPGELGKGESAFLKKYQEVHGLSPEESKQLPHPEKGKKIKETIEEIKKEIENLPQVTREISFHPTMPATQITNTLAQAIQIAINDGVDKGISFVYQTNNPYLIDAFHDILISHFIHLISE
ncbi:MAG: hypothetical protein NZ822_02320 [Patescibacteria group bacterium]|nr:hypothetical protein [Patescibacteria group bacterium]